jgi:hypothetical protein
VYTAEEIAEAGLDDFRVFLCQVWDHLNLPTPTPVQLDFAYQLQHGPDKQVLQAFRGVGKSWITAAFVLWLLFTNPQRKIMVVSASQGLADNFSIFCKSLIGSMELLHHLRAKPNTWQRDSNIMFDVGPATPDPSPSVKSVGLTGQLTGSRADVIIADDIEIPKNSYTHVLRERTALAVKEFVAVLKPYGRIVYLGTPQIEASLYNILAKERGYRLIIWPAEIPDDIDSYHGRLAPFIIDLIAHGAKPHDPVEPTRFPREVLDSKFAEYAASGYALQFMLNTNPSDVDKHPLKLKNLIIQTVDAELGHVRLVWGQDREQVLQDLHAGGFEGDKYHSPAWKSDEMTKFTGTVMTIDPSGRGTDETAYAIVRYLYGTLFLVDVGGFRDGFSEETLKALAAKVARYGVNDIVCEENYGSGMFTQLLKPHVYKLCKARFVEQQDINWSKGQKELRIMDTMEPLLQSHRLVVDRRVIEADLIVQEDAQQYSFVYQLTRMSRLKGALPHEDRLEAVSMACAYWVERMDRDKDKMHDKFKEDLLDKELRRFMDNAISFGAGGGQRRSSGLNWRPR